MAHILGYCWIWSCWIRLFSWMLLDIAMFWCCWIWLYSPALLNKTMLFGSWWIWKCCWMLLNTTCSWVLLDTASFLRFVECACVIRCFKCSHKKNLPYCWIWLFSWMLLNIQQYWPLLNMTECKLDYMYSIHVGTVYILLYLLHIYCNTYRALYFLVFLLQCLYYGIPTVYNIVFSGKLP